MLEKLLRQVPYQQMHCGEYVELPLLVEEVQAFYEQKQSEIDYANAQENRKLNGTGYNKLLQKRAALRKCLMLAEAEGRALGVAEYESKLAENGDKINKILEEKGVDVDKLIKVKQCELCGDSGIVGGAICPCAMERAEQIKAFNAAIRLEARGEQ